MSQDTPSPKTIHLPLALGLRPESLEVGVFSTDFGKKQPVFPKAYKTYSYSVLNQKENVLYYFETKYSRTKKEYVVSYVDTWTEDNK
ncbi:MULTISPECIES: hypothetical protein [Exiguobacterium]|uniref:hypothetical protein n=1 Tax=Exiguobacterium TaxID=33986 RepID=UPI001BEC9AEC|nr:MULTISPECIES: hypothetical protein [Exiguobacterium]